MRLSWRSELPQLAVIAAMFVAAVVTLPIAPERVPIRWDFSGAVSGYGPAPFALLFPPVLALAIYLLLLLLPLIDPGRANYASFRTAYAVVRWTLILFVAGVGVLIHLSLRGARVDVGVVMPLGLAILFIVLGNVMGKLRPNWFVGIRTPWTLSSKRAWTRTHQLAGPIFVAIGATFALSAIVRHPAALGLALAIAVGGTVVLAAYSYFVWRSDPDKIPPAGTLPAEGWTATDLH